MGVCISGISCCPDWIITLAVLGGALVYALIGALIFVIVKSFKDDLEWGYVVLFILLWPILIIGSVVAAVMWFIFRIITIIIMGVTKDDLIDLEVKVDKKIDRGDNKIMDYLEYSYKPSRKSKEVKAKPSKPKKAKKKSKK